MGLRMKNFNIFGIHGKILFFLGGGQGGGGSWKTYRENCQKGGGLYSLMGGAW